MGKTVDKEGKRKGRASGGMLMGVRKNIVVEGNGIEKAEGEREEEGIIMKKAKIGECGGWWVYM